jgi:ABC-type branched-subunit amino acid transport system permease subunit
LLQLIRNFEWTGGPGGLTDIPGTITGAARTPTYLAICGAAAAVTVALIAWIVHGPIGAPSPLCATKSWHSRHPGATR